jgi:hypothetical protein
VATAINANVTQQRGIKRHFNDWKGHRMFETENALKDRIIENVIKPATRVFEYAKDTPAKYSQPRKRVKYWKRCPTLCVAQDIAGLVEEEGWLLAPYETVHNNQKKLGMPLLIRADHGVGAWRSHIKVFTKVPNERRLFHEKMLLAQKEASPERGFGVLQTAEIYFRKDDSLVLTSTVTQCLDDGYDHIIGSHLLVLLCKKRGVREPMFLPRNASEMTIVITPSSRMGILEQASVQYKVAGGDGVVSLVTYFQEVSTLMILTENTIIALTVPSFCLFVTGDLSLYADSLGKSKSCSYWCMYCILTRLQWNEPNAEI